MDDLFTNLFGHNNNSNYNSSNYNSRPPVPPSNTGRSFSQQQQQPHHHQPPPMDSRSSSTSTSSHSRTSSSQFQPRTSDATANAATNPAELAKLDGNAHFAAHRYGDAIKAYSVAVIRNPANPVYYSNRALCHLRLHEHLHAVGDCERALELVASDSSSSSANPAITMKLHYYKGQALLAMEQAAEDNGHETPGRLSEAINSLKKAFDLAIASKSSYVDEISVKYRAAKAKRFERQDRKRREDVSDLHRYLARLVERDRDRQVKQLGASSSEEIEEVTEAASKRMSEIEALFSQANENSKKRYVPDAFLGKISFEIMTDPVVAPSSGITYDRSEIVSHLQKIGKWDPLTRQPLHEAELVPNLALKEVIEEFLSLNGWAYDY